MMQVFSKELLLVEALVLGEGARRDVVLCVGGSINLVLHA